MPLKPLFDFDHMPDSDQGFNAMEEVALDYLLCINRRVDLNRGCEGISI